MPVGVDYFVAVEHLIHLSRIAHAKLKPAVLDSLPYSTLQSRGYKMSRWRVASRMTDREKEALQIVHRLVDSGFRAVFAGGCVRDRILGIEPKDYDIATDARPEVVQQTLRSHGRGRGEVRRDRRSAEPRQADRSRDLPRRRRIHRRTPAFVGALWRDRRRRDPPRLHYQRDVLRSDRRPTDRFGRRDARSARRNYPRDRKSLRPLRGGPSAHPARCPLRCAYELYDRSRDLGCDETRSADDSSISRPSVSAKKS